MATQVTNYQCPSCTGPLHFSSETGNMACEYCGATYEVAVIEQLYADKEQAAAQASQTPQWDTSTAGESWSEEEAAHLRAYSCPSCGAELICDDTTMATSCPYCGNPTVVPGEYAGDLRPDYVIGFKLDKKEAVAKLKAYYQGKKFLPKTFKNSNHIEEIKGVYVPFWLFDGDSDASMRFLGTKVHCITTGEEEVTTTQHYRVARQGKIAFERVPVDGSSKMPDAHMDSIEPYNYDDLVAFSSAYLPGYLADKYDQDAQACSDRVNERLKTSTETLLAGTAKGYTTLVPEYCDISLNQGDVKYALLPVWMLSTKWQGENFLFAMNGQTGKLVGDLPVDKGKVAAWFAGISLPLMGIFGALMWLI